MFVIATLLALAADPAALAAAARARTAAARRCPRAASTDVTVCGLREADRFRVPLVDRGGRDDVAAQRAAMLRRPSPVEQLSPFLVGGGMAGVSVGTTFGAGGSAAYVRPLAP